jgi:hypothetical protein
MKWLGALVLAASATAHAWSVGFIEADRAEIGRITCGLLEKFGPSRSYDSLSIEIPTSPYGRLTATMGPSLQMEIGVSSKHYADQPAEPVRAEIRRWLVAQLPAKPTCTFLLAEPAWLVRVGYPEEPAPVPEEEYIEIQLDLARTALTAEPDDVWRWADGALAAFRGLDATKRRKHQRDPRIRSAAYLVLERPAPDGLSAEGKRGYCLLYRSIETLFPPRAAKERRSLSTAKRGLGCR